MRLLISVLLVSGFLQAASKPLQKVGQHPVVQHPAAHQGSKATCKARSSGMYNFCMKNALTSSAKSACKKSYKQNKGMCK